MCGGIGFLSWRKKNEDYGRPWIWNLIGDSWILDSPTQGKKTCILQPFHLSLLPNLHTWMGVGTNNRVWMCNFFSNIRYHRCQIPLLSFMQGTHQNASWIPQHQYCSSDLDSSCIQHRGIKHPILCKQCIGNFKIRYLSNIF